MIDELRAIADRLYELAAAREMHLSPSEFAQMHLDVYRLETLADNLEKLL